MNAYLNCLKKQDFIRQLFQNCKDEQAKYEKIIELGKTLPPFSEAWKTETFLVQGCQSKMYLKSDYKEGKIFFFAHSDALISAGLAALLLAVYNNETLEAVLKCPPAYLEDLGIGASLSPNRANGLYSIHLKMQQEALKNFIAHNPA